MKSAMFMVSKNGVILGYYKVIQLYELHSIKPNGGFYMHVVNTRCLQSFTKFVQKVFFPFGKKNLKNIQYLSREEYHNQCLYSEQTRLSELFSYCF